jgi:hypothetical protein
MDPLHAKNEALLFGADAVHPQVPRPKPLAPKSAMLGKKRCLPSGPNGPFKPIFKVARQGALIPEVVSSESSSDGKGTLRSSLVRRAKRYRNKNESLRSKSAELEAELQRAKERIKKQDS